METLNDQNINSYLFLDYIKSNGFDESNYSYILELYQSPKSSMSQFLKDTKQFLLLTSIGNCDEFKETRLQGACGYLNKDSIEIPKTLKNDMILFRNKTISINHKIVLF